VVPQVRCIEKVGHAGGRKHPMDDHLVGIGDDPSGNKRAYQFRCPICKGIGEPEPERRGESSAKNI